MPELPSAGISLVSHSRKSQEGVDRLQKILPVITGSDFYWTEQQVNILLCIMAHILPGEQGT